MPGSHLGDEIGEGLEGLEIGAGLPRRVDRRVERMHERVHVRRRQVVLFVPGRGGKDDVGVQCGRRVAEVGRPHEVEFAVDGLPPRHRGRASISFEFHGIDVVVGADEVAKEELSSLGGRTQQVGAPIGEDARHVLGGVGVLHGEAKPAFAQLARNVFSGGQPGLFRFASQSERGLVERRIARHPAALGGLDQAVGRGFVVERAGGGGARHELDLRAVVTPLAGGNVVPPGGDHLPRGALPVQGEGVVRPAGDGADLLLADVVRPPAAVDALGSAHRRQREECPVDRVGMEVVIRSRAHEDHRAPAGFEGVDGEFPADLDGCAGGHARELFLPGRSAGGGRIAVAGRPLARQPLAPHAVLREQKVEDGRDQAAADSAGGHSAVHDAGPDRTLALFGRKVESRQRDEGGLPGVGVHDRHHGLHAVELQVPVPRAFLAEMVGQRAARIFEGAVGLHDERAEVAVLRALGGSGGRKVRGVELARNIGLHVRGARVDRVVELDEERAVGVALHVVDEVLLAPSQEELLENDVPHGDGKRGVGSGVDSQPVVGELRVVGEIGGDHHYFLPVVAGLGHEVGVGRARERNVRPPHDEVLRVEPVA